MVVTRVLAAALFSAVAVNAQPVSFNRDIRPIMSDTCFRCHGPDKSSRMAKMRLDVRDEATRPLANGQTPIVPGAPDKSEIVARIFATDARKMPPEFSHKTLTEAQKQTIRKWVAEGAKYEGHWAYQPIRRPALPGNAAPGESPVDAFIEARLLREGLKFSPEADRRTLLRRASFDLTGLPPTPEEVAAFQNDQSPAAWAKVVDRLLASPHYAEKQAMHWLDAVRYADSSGFHGDNLWPAWPYRDYVLRAFRDNKPFDEFTREQLAGDLIPNATVEQKIASAYNRMNRYSAEGGLQPKEYLAKYGADRVRTLSAAWLGSTMGCAECHDHKFDPFTSKDFYSMKAFFADIKETGLMPDRGENAWGAKLLLATPAQQAKLDRLTADAETAKRELDAEAKKLMERISPSAVERPWVWQKPVSARSANGSVLTIFDDQQIDSAFYAAGSLKFEHKRGDGLIVASGPVPDNDTYTVEIRPGAGAWTALGVDLHQDESLPGARLARGADRFVLSEVEADMNGARLPFVLATANKAGEQVDGPAMAAIDGDPATGWSGGLAEARNYMIALRFGQKLTTQADSVITVRLRQESPLRRAVIGRFRVALSGAEFSWPELEDGKKQLDARKDDGPEATLNVDVDKGIRADAQEALKVAPEKRDEKQQTALLEYYEFTRPELQSALIKSAQADMQRTLFFWSIPRVVTTEATEPAVTHILPRADWMNETTEIVQPAIPAFLGKLDTGGRRANRLDLANWLVSRENPLTARAYVNRIWREFFGTGISKALDDLGSQGEEPVHPELLDWLASEFMERWDMKQVVRTIVMSRAYRQSSMSTPELDEKDPDNRLIARQSRFRVEAETVHDTALSLAGLLVDKFGGPPVRPVTPPGYLLAMNFPKRDYSQSRGEDLYRRAVYTQWQRTFLHPELLNFDAPTREECTVNRVNSNTPLQALDLLNDPIFVEAARVFAQRAVASGGRNPIDWAFFRAENRAPTAEEHRVLDNLYRESLRQFRADPKSAEALVSVGEAPKPPKAVEIAAMTTVARAILNLHETITRN
ncbi:MAG: PSD1 and planctomycete cytochrome C domain-containing protein [Acidobacteriota bacterium]